MLNKWIFLFSILFSMVSLLQARENTQVKVIVFDFGSVIAKTNKQEVVNYIVQALHLSQEEAFDALAQLKKHTSQGKNEEDFWIEYANAKGIKLPDQWVEKLDEARLHALHEIPGMVNLIKDLHKQGYQTALLSNVRQSQADIKRKLGFYDLFDPILLSYDIGVRKPNSKAYETLLNRLNVPPQAIIFVDNQAVNVEAAKSMGIDGIVFVNKDQLVQELKKRGINTSPVQADRPSN